MVMHTTLKRREKQLRAYRRLKTNYYLLQASYARYNLSCVYKKARIFISRHFISIKLETFLRGFSFLGDVGGRVGGRGTINIAYVYGAISARSR